MACTDAHTEGGGEERPFAVQRGALSLALLIECLHVVSRNGVGEIQVSFITQYALALERSLSTASMNPPLIHGRPIK